MTRDRPTKITKPPIYKYDLDTCCSRYYLLRHACILNLSQLMADNFTSQR